MWPQPAHIPLPLGASLNLSARWRGISGAGECVVAVHVGQQQYTLPARTSGQNSPEDATSCTDESFWLLILMAETCWQGCGLTLRCAEEFLRRRCPCWKPEESHHPPETEKASLILRTHILPKLKHFAWGTKSNVLLVMIATVTPWRRHQ